MTIAAFTSRSARRFAASLAAATALTAVAPAPASAQWAVFDKSTYGQTVLTAARALTQINNEIAGLQNQARMLVNQARNLTGLPYSALAALTANIQKTRQLLGQAQGLIYDVGAIQTAFAKSYPQSYGGATSQMQLNADAQTRWSNALAAYQDALKTQATVVANLDGTRTQVGALVTASQGATGALQASQAGNQLLALQTQQLADLTALLAAQGRAAALADAKTAGDGAQGRVQLQQFLTPGSGYQPTAVAMFH